VGRFTQMDTWMGKRCTPITLNKYIYANTDPVNGIDPSGNMTLSGQMAAQNGSMHIRASSSAAIRSTFKRFGCELGMSIAEEAITHGIYILSDGVNYYVGQSNDIDRRLKEHHREATKSAKKRWKAGMEVIARFTTNGGKDAMRVMEQYIMDVLEYDGKPMKNSVAAINKKRGRLRHQLQKFKDKVCR